MKKNETGKYLVTEDSIFIEDTATHQKMLFLLDRNSRVVLRSMLEDDIKKVISAMDASNSEKRKRMRLLGEELPKEHSEAYFFVAEKIVGEETKKRWNGIYELERVPIGVGCREGERIEMDVYDSFKSDTMHVLNLVAELGQHFGIDGKAWIMPRSK